MYVLLSMDVTALPRMDVTLTQRMHAAILLSMNVTSLPRMDVTLNTLTQRMHVAILLSYITLHYMLKST